VSAVLWPSPLRGRSGGLAVARIVPENVRRPSRRSSWTTVDGDGLIPVDADAEITVVGCALASEAGAVLAAEVDPAHLYDLTRRRVLEAVFELSGDLADDEMVWHDAMVTGDFGLAVEGCVRRVELVSVLTDVPVPDLGRLVRNRSVATDRTGYFARRVREAAEDRAANRFDMNRIEQATDDLAGRGVDPGRALEILARRWAA
jgi:hypothetical protein